MEMKDVVQSRIEDARDRLIELARCIGENPELGFLEYEAARKLQEVLVGEGFLVKSPIAGLETAFSAEIGSGSPKIAFICEYDALPDIGHGCGHNLIGVASLGAALGLAGLMKSLPGTLIVIGAPGEETGGGKTILVKEKIFSGVDAAMMFHPASKNILSGTTNALDAFEFTFTGKTAHAAGCPEEGVNALDAVLLFFQGVNALRQHVKDGTRIHGIITEGGKAANIVPERAVTQVYVRAGEREYLDQVVGKVLRIAEGAALMTGAGVSFTSFEYSNDNMKPNHALSELFGEKLRSLGVTDIIPFYEGKGSSDMGNVSHVVPAIHPYLSIGKDLVGHTREFAEASLRLEGMETMILAAKALSLTALELFSNPLILEQVQREHGDTKK